ncbi:hypothetical protein LTR85_009057 [Meristemomyces frigidus]|nr:hypothetical protein LTR85_009057 [Meristemomyces frigidus]
MPAMREKLGGVRTSAIPLSSTAVSPPVVTSNRNNAYFTGLDTSSHGSQRGQSGEYYAPARRSEGGTFVDPPPPYKAKSQQSSNRQSVQSGGSLQSQAIPEDLEVPPMIAAIPTLREPSPQSDRNESPFADPTTPTAGTASAGGLFAGSALPRPATSRSLTNRSFTSDNYSDTASVHSARAARMSVGGIQMVGPPDGMEMGRRGSDPFGDPESPLVSEVGSEEYHGFTGGRPSFEDGGARP